MRPRVAHHLFSQMRVCALRGCVPSLLFTLLFHSAAPPACCLPLLLPFSGPRAPSSGAQSRRQELHQPSLRLSAPGHPGASGMCACARVCVCASVRVCECASVRVCVCACVPYVCHRHHHLAFVSWLRAGYGRPLLSGTTPSPTPVPCPPPILCTRAYACRRCRSPSPPTPPRAPR